MPIVQNIDFYAFRDAFHRMNRAENFSREGLEVLFDYLEEISTMTGHNVELDVISLCCEYSEDTWETIAEQYSIEFDDDAEEDDKIETVREYLQDNTFVCGEPEDGVFVYAQF